MKIVVNISSPCKGFVWQKFLTMNSHGIQTTKQRHVLYGKPNFWNSTIWWLWRYVEKTLLSNSHWYKLDKATKPFITWYIVVQFPHPLPSISLHCSPVSGGIKCVVNVINTYYILAVYSSFLGPSVKFEEEAMIFGTNWKQDFRPTARHGMGNSTCGTLEWWSASRWLPWMASDSISLLLPVICLLQKDKKSIFAAKFWL
jgi:hypothetical protein